MCGFTLMISSISLFPRFSFSSPSSYLSGSKSRLSGHLVPAGAAGLISPD